jgi:hypothetical protein
VIVCLGIEPHKSEREKVFVIPWEAVSGKTFSLHGARSEYDGRYAPYRDRWGVIGELLSAPFERADTLRDVA